MQALFDLLHSLSKDEKRLYKQHQREGRFQAIYEAYLANSTYDKEIDREVYDKEFSDVSRPFYSMQKRALLDDVITVLFSYSNLQQSFYQHLRAIAKGKMLLERRQGELALQYLEEAQKIASENDTEAFSQLSSLRAQKAALTISQKPSFAAFEALSEQERALMLTIQDGNSLTDTIQALTLLKLNFDGLTEQEIQTKAQALMEQHQPMTLTKDCSQIDFQKLEIKQLYHELMEDPVSFHRELVQYFKSLEKNLESERDERYYRLLNLTLRSGLQVGDFLLLSGLIYRTSKFMDGLEGDFREGFLADYLETCALYHYYENELNKAIKQMETLFLLKTVPNDQAIRCTYYYVAMLIAAHLPQQGNGFLSKQVKKYNELDGQPGRILLKLMLDVDEHKDIEELSLRIDRYKNEFRKAGGLKREISCLQMIQQYLEKKTPKYKAQSFFQEDWEEVLRVDLWVQAKLDNQFYYNMIQEAWQNRKQVIN